MSISLALLVCCASAVPPAQDPSPTPQLRWEPYATVGADGEPLEGELGRLVVPADRDDPSGGTIELAFVRFRSTSAEPGTPIVFLAGGPGASGIEACIGPATGRRSRLIDHADVIAIDQRGTGSSRPNLAEGADFSFALPLDRPTTRTALVDAYRASVERCVAHWSERGVDLADYHTAASADDVEAVCAALGLDKVVLWGSSYGSHLGLAVLRRHPERVARAVLSRVEGPDHTFKLPSTTQAHLEQLDALASSESFELLGTVRALFAELEQEPAAVDFERDGETLRVTVGPYDLAHWLAGSLGLAFELAGVPAALRSMSAGDWTVLAEHALWLRRWGVESAMTLAMDCASGASPTRLARIAREAADEANLLGDAVNVPYPDACAASGARDLGASFRSPFACDVPVLFVSGTLDARTPPSNVEDIRAGFSTHAHVVVENAGHEPLEVLSPEFLALLSAFLRGERIESTTIALPPPRFR